MSHNLQRLGKLLIKSPTWDRSTPAAPPSADKSGETHPRGGKLFFESRAKQNDRHQHCQLVPDQPLQDSQLFLSPQGPQFSQIGHFCPQALVLPPQPI